MTEETKKPRGFAAMTPEKHREIASKGGKAAQEKGVAHRYTSEEARIAGAKGGRSHSREHMVEMARKGGEPRARNKREREDKCEST